jgi:hypothetical protein
MAWTAATFKARWKEFVPTDDALVNQALAEAAAEGLDPRLFGDLLDYAIGLQAAHNLAISPGGQSARLEKESIRTVYSERLDALKRQRAGGAWAIGQTP